MFKETIQSKLGLFSEIVIDDDKRSRVMSIAVYSAFAVVALVMSLLNVITMRIPLLISTSTFGAVCLLCLFLGKKGGKAGNVAEYVFLSATFVLFVYFIITGGTDNFSIIWVLLLPALGLFFFGFKKGSVISLLILLSMLAYFYIPGFSELGTTYGETFRLRFPFVYVACFAVSILLEGVRFYLTRELSRMRTKFEELYRHDALTGVRNRYNADEDYLRICDSSDSTVGILQFDIDFFKGINDQYGHAFGDIVLVELTKVVESIIAPNDSMHRWGGEEFVIMTADGDSIQEKSEMIRRGIEEHSFIHQGTNVPVTISVGALNTTPERAKDIGFDVVLQEVDRNLYASKADGRNRVTFTCVR